MNQLFYLIIDCSDVQYKQQARSTVEILNVLRPHENLESLHISHHSGTTCPNWMMSLRNLRSIILVDWYNCEFLPPLGKLPYLEELSLWVMQKVKKIGGEFLGIVDQDYAMSLKLSSSSSSFFPKLKQLGIYSMSALEEWEVGVEGWNKEDSEISIMPCLSSLEISCCKNLTTLPDFLCKTPVQELIIWGCLNLSERCQQGSGEEWPKISHIPNIKISS
ncbi:disease resistance protein RGA2-like [Pyrus x bretschneideri]|uniref:disease resistance protein RGA2-like n=1 Tax=Pyrus x bretschneideri TaxID=225117 RepID=UPI0020304863|nr:disease resistance protein RGA2-like [Pyrus x bretschneideri]